MDGWQHIMTGEGEVMLEAPDGMQVTLNSFKKLAADVAGKVDKSELDAKADKSALDKKAEQTALETKADKSALGNYIAKTGGSLTGTLHFNGKGKSGGEQRSASLQYNPYAGGNMRTEFYSTDIINDHFEHRLILAKSNDLKWFVFKDDGSAYAMQGHWQNNSDRRIKSDIEKIENGLEKVETLTGYTYVLAEHRQAGVMADELEKVLPEAVGNSGDYHESDGTVVKNVKSVAYGSITALLIEAIKDLSAKVKAQQAEIDALKASMPVAQDATE
ncbi:tail fiber domain-containing protein [Sodalis glossinidius]|nr:tail fiber domain-containing protein [Sodalis glossinidius]